MADVIDMVGIRSIEGRHAFWEAMRGFAARGKTIVFRAVLMANGTIVAEFERIPGVGIPAPLYSMIGLTALER